MFRRQPIQHALKTAPYTLQLQILRHKSRRSYSFDETFFDDGIISDAHASVWGLFLTDGCLANKSIPSGKKIRKYPYLCWKAKYDSYVMLDKIRNIMESTHTLNFDVDKYGYIFCHMSWRTLTAWKGIECLMGCKMGQKTFHLKFPLNMDSQWYPSLVRTIIDGDGCWALNRVNDGYVSMRLQITSANKQFLESIKNVIALHCFDSQDDIGSIGTRSNGNCFDLKYYDQRSCNKIGQWLYTTGVIESGLLLDVPRKYSRFLLFQQLYVKENKPKPRDRHQIAAAFLAEESR
eukprot:222639_1